MDLLLSITRLESRMHPNLLHIHALDEVGLRKQLTGNNWILIPNMRVNNSETEESILEYIKILDDTVKRLDEIVLKMKKPALQELALVLGHRHGMVITTYM